MDLAHQNKVRELNERRFTRKQKVMRWLADPDVHVVITLAIIGVVAWIYVA